MGSLVKQYDTGKHIFLAVSDLKIDLELFTSFLKQEGFVPKA